MTKKFEPEKHPRASGTLLIENLETARLLSDPFKLKILQHFAEHPRTTKQVADMMGEKAPRLYRHVDSLLEHGVLDVIHEQPKRGTIERYLQAVAARFEIDSRLFAPDNDQVSEAHNALRNILRTTEDEFIQALSEYAAPDTESDIGEELEPIMMKMAVRGSPAQLMQLRQRLLDWVEHCQENPEPVDESLALDCRGLIAFYPVAEQTGQQD